MCRTSSRNLHVLSLSHLVLVCSRLDIPMKWMQSVPVVVLNSSYLIPPGFIFFHGIYRIHLAPQLHTPLPNDRIASFGYLYPFAGDYGSLVEVVHYCP
ncbi:hypothetical protein QBC32DRAFT_6401 [Pseudoneurospora amorphoporcata]|uniref:Uncharacterized protein n=1 Tax=Pseudoneurospora amorphoporcata TaxID=241081 RepID=A0AAN6NVY8_9PEZI|nr:hypothetical protein QBC32DRAFT_6401 [Pseudoneurospora amorphoporcata]